MTNLLLSLLLLIHLFFTIAFSAKSDDSSYPNCPSYSCGNVSISYPFWSINHESPGQFCGYQGFGINCSGEGDHAIPEITLGGHAYYVQVINYEAKSLDVSAVATVPDNCPRVHHNINLEKLPLNFSMYSVNISFHYNCTGCPSFARPIACMDENRRRSCVHMIMDNRTDESDWVEYSCSEKVVTTVVSEYVDMSLDLSRDYGRLLERGFRLMWWTMDVDDCQQCEESSGRCGIHDNDVMVTTSRPGNGIMCFCNEGTINYGDCKDVNLSWRINLIIGLGFLLLLIVIFPMLYWIKKSPSSDCVASLKHKSEDDKNIEAFVIHYGSLSTKRYNYHDLKRITNSFKVKIGHGGFGQVFIGKLPDGRLVAVKVLNSSKTNGQEFINEVASIGRTSHVNIVTLLGFCFDYRKRALVYEYMPNGSLEKFIHNDMHTSTTKQIGLKKLYEIALGIACGLDYLHRGCNTRILHLDIKPHNILLDEDFCPKIADFGLAKLYSRKESIVSMLEARGTIGYIAPEVYNKNFGGVSHKSDVYSYGMLLLEMVGGRKNIDAGVGSGRSSDIYFPDWIYNRLQKDGFISNSVTTTEENDYARKMAIVGFCCIQPAPNQRPTIVEVIEMLEERIEALKVPPKPFFSSPPRSPTSIYSTSESMHT